MSEEIERQVVADMLGIRLDRVEDARAIAGGRIRYNYHLAKLADGSALFVKTTSDPKLKVNLQREAFATPLAAGLGIATKTLMRLGERSYFEINGVGLVAFHFLEPEEWWLLSVVDDIWNLARPAQDVVASTATDLLTSFSGAALDPGLDTSRLRQGETADWRYRSPEHMDRVWDESIVVLERIKTVFPGIQGQEYRFFEGALQEGRAYTQAAVLGQEGEEYLVHGDFDPYNMAINRLKEIEPRGLVLDFEEAGKTPYRRLARLSDAANFFGRCWPSPELQGCLIRQLALEMRLDGEEGEREFLRTMVIFGAFYLAKYAMEPGHKEHNMAMIVLSHLGKNLRLVDYSVFDV